MTERGVPSRVGDYQPLAWGSDDLSNYLEDAQRNRLATFVHRKARFEKLRAIDLCFVDSAKDWLNPPNPVTAMLLIRTQSSFRVACSAAMAGQVVETFVLIRAMLETAGYAAHIARNTGLAEIWLRRHDNASTMKNQKKNFEIGAVKKSIRSANVHAANRFDRMYQDSIDFGAHPNASAVLGSTTIRQIDGGSRLDHVLLHTEGIPMDDALVSTARSGLCALEVLQIAFAARFELLGINSRMLTLRIGL